MTGPKREPGIALRHHNRRVLAERLHWPDGVLEACARVEVEHPGWVVFWMRENTTPGFERPAGFHAVRGQGKQRLETYAPDVERLVEAIDAAPPEEHPVFNWIEPSKRR